MENHSDASVTDQPRMRRRDRLRQLARSTSVIVKDEINRLYYYNEPDDQDAQSINRSSPSLKRTDTQEIDAILNSGQDPVRPQCMLFPTYAVQVMDRDLVPQWKIKLAGWTFVKPGSSRLERWLIAAGRTYGGVLANSAEDTHFARLVNQFRCQTLRSANLCVRLADLTMQLSSASDIHINSGPSGRFEHTVVLGLEDHGRLQSKVLRLEALLEGIANRIDRTPFQGYVDLIEPTGISVISDIDDTIKITDILDGRDAILHNTFFRKAQEVPGMARVYQSWANKGARIHYVSNGPWQVYPALEEFFTECHFPQGSMHLRVVNTGDLLRNKLSKHKLATIPSIIQEFPHRKFILVGDSGEMDPEIYQSVYEQFPDQVIKIFIRDVTSERATYADRRANEKRRTDSYYSSVRKFISREASSRRSSISSMQHTAMDAMSETEMPVEQQHLLDPNIPLGTKLQEFEERMHRVSNGMREGVFTVFTRASQLVTDTLLATELAHLASNTKP